MSLSRGAVSIASIFVCLSAVLLVSMPQAASAQVNNACANNINGDLKIVTAGANNQIQSWGGVY